MKTETPKNREAFWFCLVVICIFALTAKQWVTGDGGEYLAMTKAFAEFRLPAYLPGELQDFHQWLDAQYFSPKIRLDYPSLISVDGRQDFPHFWTYSLFVVPFWWFTKLFHIPEIYAFTLFNISFLVAAFWVAAKAYSKTALLLILASPIVWWLSIPHTEVFTIASIMMGVTLTSQRRFLLASIPVAIATTQNLPWAPLVFVLHGFAAIQVPLKDTLHNLPRIFEKWRSWSLVLISLSITLIHPVYYYLRIEAITPQLKTGFARIQDGDLTRYLAVLFDPDIGLFVTMPIQMSLVLVSLVAIAIPSLLNRVKSSQNSAIFRQSVTGVGFFLFSLWLLYSFAQTVNVNSGATPSISRYALWLIPLMLPFLEVLALWINQQRSADLKPQIFYVLSYSLFAVYLAIFSRVGGDHLKPTPASTFVYEKFPCLYQPVPEVFVERQLHIDGRKWSAANPSCSLSFIQNGLYPPNCKYSAEIRQTINQNLAEGTVSNWVIQTKSGICRSQVIPLPNTSFDSALIKPISNVDFLPSPQPDNVQTLELDGVEGDLSNQWRWALGPQTTLVFHAAENQQMDLAFRFDNIIPEQSVTVLLNDNAISKLENLKPQTSVEKSLKIKVNKGMNRVVLQYAAWNSPQTLIAPNDPRPLAVSFRKLTLRKSQ